MRRIGVNSIDAKETGAARLEPMTSLRMPQKIADAHFDHFHEHGVGEDDLFTLVFDNDALRATTPEPSS
jgi:hypothetical protein